MSDLKSRLANLTPEQRAEFLRRLKESQAAPATILPHADRSQALALSFAQRRLWFLERLDGSSAAYNMPAAFRLRGTLDVAALQAALSGVTARHEVLRTRLVEQDGEPQQVIDPPQPLALPLVDLSGATRQEEALHGLLREDAARPFDLAREQPLRALLVKLGPEEHVVAINVHHVASDGWSTGIMVRELAALYNAHRAGQAAPLAELPVQYADYAAWQLGELAQPGKFAASLDFWRKQLADAPAGTNLPTDFARAAKPSSAGDNVWFGIDAEATAKVRALAQQHDASVYQVLLTVFLILLQRWSGDTDITVGSPIANRPRPELEGLIGFFVNTLPIRVPLADDPDFLTLLARVRAVTLESYAHAEIPFEQLVEKINPERRLNQSPFFQVMFAMQNAAATPAGGLDGLQIDTIPVASGASRLDLTLSMQDSEAGLSGCLEYASALFRPETAQRFTEHFRNLLNAALRDSLPVSRLEILSKAERHRLLVEWNRTETQRDRRLCLHHLVEQQSARTPDAPALRWNDEVWSYSRLLDESTRIARLLQQRGIAPDTLVGVCLDRSPRMVAALLGVLRSGGAYVALDPAYPAARLAYIVADSAAPVILTNRRYRAEIFAAMPASEAIALDEVELPGDDAPLPDGGATPAHLAYVLYTSGSTGKPKGVAIEHHSPAAFLDWARSVWPLDELAGVLAGTSICFDLSIFEIFLPLSVGGTVILAENVLELPTIPARDRVTLINTVPSAIDALLRQNAVPAGVRVVNLAGEPLTTELADRVYGVPNVAKVYDLYGPSEDTTYSTCKLRQPGEAPSIGRPIANTCLYILDRALQPVPVGVPGEIYLGGEGLARGYLGKDHLTAERFVPSPFPAVSRLYRTSDLARFRPDGNVEYLGRIDHQVKLRGFRIELGEIESVLREFPGAANSVVIVSTTSAGNQRLIGYLAHPQGDAILPELRAHLVARLPDYMVPAALVVLPTLPLTPNGKIDRQALPAPEARASTEHPTPTTPEETRLAAIWEELLGREPGSLHRDDDFFALGGHSLLAVRLQSRIRDRYAREVALRELFEHPLLHQQAALLAGAGNDAAEDAIPPCDRSQPLALSFAQERLWFLDQLEPGNPAYNMPGALRLTGTIDITALQAAFAAVVARHEILRLAFPAQGGVAGAVPLAEPPRLALVDLRGQPAAVAAYLDEDARRPFDLAHGPLIRAAALLVADREIVLAATLHHIVADGWSIGLFLDELCRHYAAPGELAPLAIQYLDFAAWQRSRYAAGQLEPHLAYGQATLADAPPLLTLPTDRPRPAAQGYRGATLDFTLDAALTARLGEANRRHGTTPFMTLLAAYAALLGRYAGQEDLVIGFPSAGRGRSELEPLIGMFVNTLPIRLHPANDASFAQFLAQTRERTLAAIAHQDLPFEKLVDALGITRTLAWSPLFQALFIMQNASGPAALPAGIGVEPFAAGSSESAKFDLTLALAEQGDHLAASFEYDRDLFEHATIARMAGHFVALLDAALAQPDFPLAALPGPAVTTQNPAPATRNLPDTPPPVAPQAPASPAEQALAEVWREVLNLPEIGVDDNYFALGGDSILTIVMIAKLRERGWQLQLKDVFRHQTIRALAAVLAHREAQAPAIEEESGRLALTPLQRMFFDLQPPSPHHFNQALLLRLAVDVTVEHLEAALYAILHCHPALRSRFSRDGGGWHQEIGADAPLSVAVHDLQDIPAPQRHAELESRCNAAQRSLDISHGPLFRATLFRLGGEEARLLLVAHHLVVDAVSWRVIVADLESALHQARSGAAPQLPAEPCGPTAYRRALEGYDHRAELGYWQDIVASGGDILQAFETAPPGAPHPAQVISRLPAAETRSLLTDAHRAYHTRVPDLLLTALGGELCRLAGRNTVLVEVEGHGRDALGDAIDLSRSVGWFTTLYPVRLACPPTRPLVTSLPLVKEALRSAPHSGIGFALGHHGGGAPASADVCFNYLGQGGAASSGAALLGIAPESSGDASAADLPRRYRLECNASVVNDELILHYGFDAGRLAPALVEGLASATLAALRQLIADCLAQQGATYTPSDFAEVRLEQAELDDVLDGLDLSGMIDE